MSKRKGVSFEEKRSRMLQLFYERKEFFTMNELESIGSKEKGVVAQSIKEVVQTLVDDGLVCTDKIGTSNYYWAFPGQNITSLEHRIAEANKKIVEAEFKLQKLKDEIEKEKIGKEDTEERQIVLREVEDLRNKEKELREQLTKFSDVDPEVIAQLNDRVEQYRNGINTWTDNIFAIQSWCDRKFNISKSELNKNFRIPDDLDYKE